MQDMFIIARNYNTGMAEVTKEYHNKTRQEVKEICMFLLCNMYNYICICPTKEEAENTCKGLNGK